MESVEIIKGGFLELEAGAKGKRSVKRRSPSKKSKPKRRTTSRKSKSAASKKRRSASKSKKTYKVGGCMPRGTPLQEQAYFLKCKYSLMTTINQDNTNVFDKGHYSTKELQELISDYKKEIADLISKEGYRNPSDAEVRSYAEWYRGCPSTYKPGMYNKYRPQM